MTPIIYLGTLTELDAPGHFDQQLIFFGFETPAVDYNIIYIDDEAKYLINLINIINMIIK